jgi:hypothetical protein
MMLLINSVTRILNLRPMMKRKKDRKALTQIQLHLLNNILQDCLQEKNATALWLKLESICMSKDLTSKMHMKMKLYSHKLWRSSRRSFLIYRLWR